jgi:hypothetical protein
MQFALQSSGESTILVKVSNVLEEMVASTSGSRHTLLHQTDTTGKMDHYENVKSYMESAYLKHTCIRY